ncbi:MAG TPA: serine protease [Burkholderiales bacterium]|nr:serine protease [Burkholderiales bacterium]
MHGDAKLTNATAFFFERNNRLFLVTARHVLFDEPSGHNPDRLLIELHTDPENVADSSLMSVPLYHQEQRLWREAVDSSGIVDIAVVELFREKLPVNLHVHAFSEASLVDELKKIEVGTPVLIVGFPLGFHDTLHHLPVARQAVIASAFGIRFQGHGYFLTDAQMHRGASGAPVVARPATQKTGRGDLDWMLLGVHTTRMDVANRDVVQDERLNLNCAWYADVILTLTE